MDEILQQVTVFAGRAHGDQRRKFADEPYINHLVRVMEICRQYSQDRILLIAALLHDVLEDTEVSNDGIKNFLEDLVGEEDAIRATRLVEELTDIYTKKNYPKWNRRQRKSKEAERLSKTSGEAQTIKYADIMDNSLDVHKSGSDFTRVFLFECRALLKVMKQGNEQLHQNAMETVLRCIRENNNPK
jgi:(p)ppGpp synthase/HD superfamily hydrolase